jgi:hypothetical protein
MQSDPSYPLIYKSSILPRAEVTGAVNSARKHIVIKRPSATFEPSQKASAGGLQELELDGPARLLLDDDRAGADSTATDKVTNLDFDDVATVQFAVDCQIKYRPVA